MMLLNNDHGHPCRMPQCFTVFFRKQTGAAGSSQGEPYDETLPPDNPYIITLPWKNGIMIRTMFTSCSVLIQNRNRVSSSMRIKVQAAA